MAPFSFFNISAFALLRLLAFHTLSNPLTAVLSIGSDCISRYLMVPSFTSVVIVFLASLQKVQYLEMTHERIHSKDGRTDGAPREQLTKKTTLHNFISAFTSLTLVALVILSLISLLVTLVILRLSSRLVA